LAAWCEGAPLKNPLTVGVIFGLASALGMSMIYVGHMLGFFGLPFMVILVPAGLLLGGALAGSTIDRHWTRAVPRLAMTFLAAGVSALLSFFFTPRELSPAMLIAFFASWLTASFAVAGVVAAGDSQGRPCSAGRILTMFAMSGLVGSAVVGLAIHLGGVQPYVAMPLGIVGGFAVVGTLIAALLQNPAQNLSER
jgi:hypothetical protein